MDAKICPGCWKAEPEIEYALVGETFAVSSQWNFTVTICKECVAALRDGFPEIIQSLPHDRPAVLNASQANALSGNHCSFCYADTKQVKSLFLLGGDIWVSTDDSGKENILVEGDNHPGGAFRIQSLKNPSNRGSIRICSECVASLSKAKE